MNQFKGADVAEIITCLFSVEAQQVSDKEYSLSYLQGLRVNDFIMCNMQK